MSIRKVLLFPTLSLIIIYNGCMTDDVYQDFKPELSEKQIQDGIFSVLVTAGFLVLRVNQGASMMQNKRGAKRFVRFVLWQALGHIISSKGIADLLCLSLSGKFYAIEVKRPGKKASKVQQEFLDVVNTHNGIGIVADSVDEVVSVINANEELSLALF